ncbi:unnamed protein product [Alopecurus aequalis]
MESTPSATNSSTGAGHVGASVLLFPMPGAQGHLNPMLQFGRRLAYHGLRPTLVSTRYILSTTPPPGDPFRVAAISDGFDAGGSASCPDIAVYISRLAVVGRRPRRGVLAVNIIYGELCAGRLALPVTDVRGLVERGALGVDLGPEDVPPFVASLELSPGLRKTSVGQFEGLEEADDVLVNSFSDIEPEEAKYMESTWRAKMIGPTLPSFYLDDHRLPSNKSYGFDLFGGDELCMDWMEKQSINSVVLVSYGTFSQYDAAQLEELGNGLCNSGKPFLWVVRSKESHKLSEDLKTKCEKKGLIVSWCPQLAVLSHKAIGCFVTHCGWNSTLEAIVCGVPLVGIPHWADQPTIAKYVESSWGIGVRTQPGEKGWINMDEVSRCIKVVMDGENKDEYRRNAVKWMEKAKEATREGGSSDKNILEFAAKYFQSNKYSDSTTCLV